MFTVINSLNVHFCIQTLLEIITNKYNSFYLHRNDESYSSFLNSVVFVFFYCNGFTSALLYLLFIKIFDLTFLWAANLIMVNLHLVLFPSWNISFQKILFNFSNTIYLGFFFFPFIQSETWKGSQMVLYEFISKVDFNLIKMLTTYSLSLSLSISTEIIWKL